MIPILFDKNETTFTSNGKGRLFPISCVVTEERNGKYEAEIRITEQEKHYSDIELYSLIGLQVSDGSMQLFRIYAIDKTLETAIVLKCAHISYDLSYIPVAPITATDIDDALTKIKSQSLVPNPFNFDTDIESEARYEMKHPLSARAYLGGTEGSILDKYHGEYSFNNYNVFLHSARGSNNGVQIRYGKNLVKLENKDTCEDTIDGLVPYWTDGTFYVMGGILRAKQGNKIITEDVTESITLPDGVERPTVAQVETAGLHHLAQKVTDIEKSLKISWYEDKTISDVQLCDTVNVIYEPYSINVEMKVTRTKWDVLEEHYDEIELGEYKSFVKTLNEMSTDISNLKYNDGQTSIRLERTENGLEAEVRRAMTEEDDLSTTITQTAEEIKSTAAAHVKEYNEGNLSIDYYGYGEPSDTLYPPEDNDGKYYLDRNTGYYYICDGSSWNRSLQPLQPMTDLMQSEISQTAREIKMSVATTIKQWDTQKYYDDTGRTITVFGIGEPNNTDYPPATYSGQYYLDQQSGKVWYSSYSYVEYDYIWADTYDVLQTVDQDIYGELSLRIRNDDNGTGLVSVLNGMANHIDFIADNMFTVTAPNLNIDQYGNVTATNFIGDNCILKETTSFKDGSNTLVGYIGKTTVESEDGFGMRNRSTNPTGSVLINPSSGNLWLEGDNTILKLSSDGLEPWTPPITGAPIPLGSSVKPWSSAHLKNITLYNDATTATDSHLGSAYKIYVKDGNQEYKLKEYIKGLIDHTIT